jgi:hypothetical protein
MADTVVILTSGTSWTVPADWNPAANTIEAIGGGAAGGATVGGAGADYAKVSNQSLSGSITIAIGAAGTSGGNGGDTTFGSILLAKGGGSSSTDIGSTTYAGGTGNAAGGGGGAAGLNGAGGNAPGAAGGMGDNGTVAADTSGTEWGTAGSGGGGSYSAPAGSPTVVQFAGNYKGGGSSFTVTLGSAPTSGNQLVLAVQVANGGTLTTPTGFTSVGSTGGYGTIVYYYTKVSAGTETTVTIAGSTLSYSAIYFEATPCSSVALGGSSFPAVTTSPVSMISETPTAANALALSYMAFSPNVGTVTASSPWTTVIQQPGSATNIRSLTLATQAQTSIAATSGTWSFTPAGGSGATSTLFLLP